MLKSTSQESGFLSVLSEHIKNTTQLTQTKFDMEIKAIKNESDYDQAMERLEQIFHAQANTPEGDEAEVLSILIEKYEEEHYPIGMSDPIEAIKFRMEQMNMNQKDLAKIVGFTSRVSEVLNKKRKLTLGMIRKLSTTLDIPTEVLVQEY